MTQNHPPARHGALFWAGVTLLALWNGGLIWLAVDSAQTYDRCVANDGIICFDFTLPILVVMFAVDALVALTVWFVRWLRVRRADRPG